MVQQILSLSLRRNIPVANYTITVGFETTPQRMDHMKVRLQVLFVGVTPLHRLRSQTYVCPDYVLRTRDGLHWYMLLLPCHPRQQHWALATMRQFDANFASAVIFPETGVCMLDAAVSRVCSVEHDAGGVPRPPASCSRPFQTFQHYLARFLPSYLAYIAVQDMTPDQRRKHLVKYAIGGAAGVLAVGGVAAALAFGSLAMTAGELPIGDLMSGADMGDIFSGIGDMGDCCGGCGECCGDCGDVCGACVSC
jgi:hypothetical protein